MTRGGVWFATLAVAVLGCSVGEGGDGFGSANSIGGGDAATETGGDGGSDGNGTDWNDDNGLGTIGGQTGSMEDESGDDGPINPNEVCNGIDDDANGQVDDGLGMLDCGIGACANSTPACVDGVPGNCTPLAGGAEVCNGLDDDCDGQTDEELTGSCSSACGSGTETCVGGVPECDAPQPAAESCNYSDDDCDGALDEDLAGCRVGVHRSFNGSTVEHFYTTSLAEAMTPGFMLENQDYYFVYAAEHPGLVPFYRCLKGNGKHFYTQSGTCEGQTVEGVLGYVSSSDADETTPLYRLYQGTNGNHFYTTSAAERDNAVANLGYAYEAIACYVF